MTGVLLGAIAGSCDGYSSDPAQFFYVVLAFNI